MRVRFRFLLPFCLFLFVFGDCCSLQLLSIKDGYICEVYSPSDEIPKAVLEEANEMYLEAYFHPPLHLKIPLEELGFDLNIFCSYAEYIEDMFEKDFFSYGEPEGLRRHYFQLRCNVDGPIVGVCCVLENSNPGFYYLDHIGVHWKFRRQGLADSLIKVVVDQLSDFIEISLDTRIFNLPAQALYEKWGFKKLSLHPSPAKKNTYFRYVLYRGQG